MSISDSITLLVLVLGFLITLFTYVSTIALKPRLAMIVGLKMLLHYTHNNRLMVTMDFVFLNAGAQPGVLIDLSGKLKSDDGTISTEIRWEKFEETTNIAPPGTPSKFYRRSGDLVHLLILPGRATESGGVLSTIRLFTDMPFTLQDTQYLLEVTGLEGSTLRRKKMSCSLQLQSGAAAYLQRYCTENEKGEYNNRLSFTREISSQKTGWRLLRKPPAIQFISQRVQPSPAQPFESTSPS